MTCENCELQILRLQKKVAELTAQVANHKAETQKLLRMHEANQRHIERQQKHINRMKVSEADRVFKNG